MKPYGTRCIVFPNATRRRPTGSRTGLSAKAKSLKRPRRPIIFSRFFKANNEKSKSSPPEFVYHFLRDGFRAALVSGASRRRLSIVAALREAFRRGCKKLPLANQIDCHNG